MIALILFALVAAGFWFDWQVKHPVTKRRLLNLARSPHAHHRVRNSAWTEGLRCDLPLP
jgi:hypothetical protein